MASTAIHPHGETGQSTPSEFGRVAAAIDEAERLAGERVGGPTCAELTAIKRQEARLTLPEDVDDWMWLARRLARSIENGWHGGAVKPLLRLAE